MHRSPSLRLKLSLAFLLIAALVAVVGVYEIRSASRVHKLFTGLVSHGFARRGLLNKMNITANQIDVEAMQFAIADKNLSSKDAIAAEKKALSTQDQKLNGYLTQYQQLLKDDNAQVQKQMSSALQTQMISVERTAAALVDTTGGPAAQLAPAYIALAQSNSDLNNTLNRLITAEDSNIAQQDSRIDTAVSKLMRNVLMLMAGVIVMAAILGWGIVFVVSRSLRKLQIGAQRIANGDFTQRVEINSRDEIGQLATTFNGMSDRLRDSYRRLALETERDKTLLESLGEGVIAIDEHAKIVLLNDKAIEILELPARDELIDTPVNHAFTVYNDHDKPLAGEQSPAVAALKTKKAVNSVLGFHRKDKTKILLAVGANPVVVEGKIAGAIMTMRDVTKEKEVDRMKTEFISLASHQLRTPLSAIKWFSEMLVAGDAGKLKSDQLDFAKNIAESTERMIALVNALLNISRIESGRILIDPKPTDLRELVTGIINDLKAKTEQKKQTLVVSVHQDLPKIKLDPRLIGQVFLNLLTNAIKYTPKGGEISVLISRKGDQIISQVTDNGYGIPAAQQDRVFQKFFRAANAVKIETDGTGLGLYLIKAVIESSGGKIWFKSEEGKGTTFWFSIPVTGMKRKEGEVTLDV